MSDSSITQRLQFLPISVFATVMGMSGLTIAWEKTQQIHGFKGVAELLLAVTLALFILLAFTYARKYLLHKEEVIKEFHHPVRLSFFPTISISLILLSIASFSLDQNFSLVLWGCGSVLHLIFTIYIMNAWIGHEHFKIQHMNPAWFIPVVGNMLVPIVGVEHGFSEISWFFFSFAILYWLILLTIVSYRIIFHDPLPGKLLPTFFILIAPPAVGLIAYWKLNGHVDNFAHILYYSGLFTTLLLFSQIHNFARLKFFLSWWAYSFPLAAITIASYVMYQDLQLNSFLWLARALLIILSVVIAGLILLTIKAIRQGEICIPEE